MSDKEEDQNCMECGYYTFNIECFEIHDGDVYEMYGCSYCGHSEAYHRPDLFAKDIDILNDLQGFRE